MADYYSILKKTIASLPESNGAARRSVYSRARNAIVNQLKAYEPPLSPSEITAEQLRLEEAIRKVEAEAARESLGLGAPVARPPAQPAPPQSAPSDTPAASSSAQTETTSAPEPEASVQGEQAAAPSSAPEPSPAVQSPLKETVSEAQTLGGAASRAVQNAKDVAEQPNADTAVEAEDTRREPSLETGAQEDADIFVYSDEPASLSAGLTGTAGQPAPEASSGRIKGRNRRNQPSAADALRSGSSQGRMVPIALAGVLTLAVLGGGAYFLWPDGEESSSVAPSSATVATEPTPASPETVSVGNDTGAAQTSGAAEDGSEKNTDRLLGGNDPEPVAPDARTVTTTLITPEAGADSSSGQDSIVTNVESTPAIVGGAPEPVTPADTPAAVSTPEDTLAATAPQDAPAPQASAAQGGDVQRSILYEEGEDAGGTGTAAQGAVTWSVEEETGLDGKSHSVLSASVEVPERDVKVDIRIKPNDDTSLPASHLVEIKYDFPEGFAAGDIVNVPGLVMKPTEEARGDALIGASVKVSPGYFWIALSSLPNEQQRNLALLRERGWIDIPMLYENGKRGILTLEKGSVGSEAVEKVIAAWQAG